MASTISYDNDGRHRFSRGLGGSGFNEGFGVIEGPSGNVFLTGHSEGTADLGGGNLSGHGNEDLFLVSLDSNGNHRWSTVWGGSGDDSGRDLAFDDAGNIYVAGYFAGNADFDGVPLSSAGQRDVVVANLTEGGQLRWAK